MNIYATSLDPCECAVFLDDTRIAKAAVEIGQILSTAIHVVASDVVEKENFYKPSGKKHPCVTWTRETRKNYQWVIEHGLHLCFMYNFIYGKIHASQGVIESATRYWHRMPIGRRTGFVNCTSYKEPGDMTPVTELYQKYLNYKWEHDKKAPEWFDRSPPPFFFEPK